jgi:futalosine hydrolase
MSQHKSVLITAATEAELTGVRNGCADDLFPNLNLTFLNTGVGMVNTALHLTETVIEQDFDLAINIGIAGSYDPQFVIGDVVQVSEDRIAWFGAEDRDDFLPAEDMGLCKKSEVVFAPTLVVAHLPKAKSITVNMAHGSANSISRAMQVYSPQIESMEGAAFFRVCEYYGYDALQVRAISNRVEPRNRDAWNIPLALNNLTSAVLQILEDLDNGN